MNGYFDSAVDIILGLIGAGSVFLLFFGELVSRRIRTRREGS